MNRIVGKIAVITGGTQGLGAAVARLFAKAGAAGIAIVGRDQAKGDALARQITQDTGVPVQMIAADLAEMDQVMTVVSKTVAQFGKIDIIAFPDDLLAGRAANCFWAHVPQGRFEHRDFGQRVAKAFWGLGFAQRGEQFTDLA